MRFRASATIVIGAVAVIAATSVYAVVRWRASQATTAAGFWWDDAPFILSRDDAAKIGGPLTAAELATIRTIARADVERAFADLGRSRGVLARHGRRHAGRKSVVQVPVCRGGRVACLRPTRQLGLRGISDPRAQRDRVRAAIGVAWRDRRRNRPRHRPRSRP